MKSQSLCIWVRSHQFCLIIFFITSSSHSRGAIITMACKAGDEDYWCHLGRRQWRPTPVLLPGKFHGWRNLVCAVHGVAKSRTRLSDFTFTFHFHTLEKEMATHSSVLAWRIPWTEKPGRLQSMGSHRVGHDWSDLAAAAAGVILEGFYHRY